MPDHETLLRVVRPKAAAVWMKDGKPSSAMFSDDPPFSADMERLANLDEVIARWTGGNGIVAFNCCTARTHGFHTRHEPELFPNSLEMNTAHCNVYGVVGTNDRKRRARALAETCRDTIRRMPDPVPPPAV